MKEKDSPISLGRFLNRFTLIVGEINTGKTTLTQKVLDAYSRQEGDEWAVVDLAPAIPPSLLKGHFSGVGGTLRVSQPERVRYFHCPIHAPRLQGKSAQEQLGLAVENAHRIDSLFERALAEKADVLFVNDCSLYLQAGEVEKLTGWIRSAETAIVNGYYGRALGTGVLSAREREGMEALIRGCDRVIRLVPHGSCQADE